MATPRITSFNLEPGRVIANTYVVQERLGGGWEGEVYKVLEPRTGAHRAAKLFFPHRNTRDRAVTFYARKLERLRQCPIVIQYLHSEKIEFEDRTITCLISEYVEGRLLSEFVRSRPGKRLTPFQALHLLYPLIVGIEQIHRRKDYHGDLHAQNVLVIRDGIFFTVKIVDFYHWGRATAAHYRDDLADLVRLLYDAVGGRAHYKSQPPEIKAICCGLRRDLIFAKFKSISALREHLETFAWSD
jgi:tRNA A-37 threonylcarbamoyl transferase component Bud32